MYFLIKDDELLCHKIWDKASNSVKIDLIVVNLYIMKII